MLSMDVPMPERDSSCPESVEVVRVYHSIDADKLAEIKFSTMFRIVWKWSLAALLVPLILITPLILAYSYLLYRQEKIVEKVFEGIRKQN